MGQELYLKLVDRATGGFGHINLDYVRIPGVKVAPKYVIYDFDSLAGWTATGNAFSAGDIAADTTYWGGPFNQHGAHHLWSFKEGGDAQTGELRSDVFTLGGDAQIRFLISGGNNINELYLVLVRASDGVELPFKETGNSSEGYVERSFDARAYIGQQLYLKLVDRATGGFGHINLDYVRIPIQ
jgi:hypothetical protein